MNNLSLNRATMSRAVWEVILNDASETANVRNFFLDMMHRQNDLRDRADYNTGSIGPANAWCTYAVAKYFNPNTIAEVGTFIGCSTQALAYGMFVGSKKDTVASQKMILTCDLSNDIPLNHNPYSIHLEQFPKKSSVDMFQSMHEQNIYADLMNIDGRLGPDDLALIQKVIHERTVFILDDFEGLEKGVANAFALMSILKNYGLVYPPDRDILSKHGFTDYCNTALLIPLSIVQLTNQ